MVYDHHTLIYTYQIATHHYTYVCTFTINIHAFNGYTHHIGMMPLTTPIILVIWYAPFIYISYTCMHPLYYTSTHVCIHTHPPYTTPHIAHTMHWLETQLCTIVTICISYGMPIFVHIRSSPMASMDKHSTVMWSLQLVNLQND